MSQNSTLFQRGILRPTVKSLADTAYELTLGDEQSIIRFTSNTDITVTIPNDLAFPKGYIVHFHQWGDGRIEVVGEAGVTLGASLNAKTRDQHSALSLFHFGSNEWSAVGDQGI